MSQERMYPQSGLRRMFWRFDNEFRAIHLSEWMWVLAVSKSVFISWAGCCWRFCFQCRSWRRSWRWRCCNGLFRSCCWGLCGSLGWLYKSDALIPKQPLTRFDTGVESHCEIDVSEDLIPYTEPTPQKEWKTFLIEIDWNGYTTREIVQCESLEIAERHYNGAISIIEVKINIEPVNS